MGLSMSFQIGEKVVYPNHGVGTIENISQRWFGNRPQRFYLLRLSSSSLTVMVPVNHVSDVGLRKVTKNGEVCRVLDFLSNGTCRWISDWKNRFKENSEKMRVGGMLEIAEVLKSLLQLQSSKTLSFREKKMLDRARYMLITEVAASRAIQESEAIALIDRALNKSNLRLPEPL